MLPLVLLDPDFTLPSSNQKQLSGHPIKPRVYVALYHQPPVTKYSKENYIQMSQVSYDSIPKLYECMLLPVGVLCPPECSASTPIYPRQEWDPTLRDLQTRLPVTVRNYSFCKCVKRVRTAFVIRYSQRCGMLLCKNCQDPHLR